ncbi:N-acetyl-D-Glu racemase DgcA [Brucella pseudogrignonensis]|jgi:L-alanine-DL-glutamate epimerase-like enolase superfamily enzyme|uniref:Dipeptide epimerase n=1 Tax=Brucella pseudogrignonensis TaxID=419475 RepID=A0A256GDX8_9HYPH|nr:N-acetyl-D-Glu racemase DgcA [Brucella pseudogrignonensis]EMG54552.1 mandelate racemase/muconate lactonizing protein [Ochrobactrum sp. CDB2]NKX16077.1 dipeptide epimerase [Brucella pseudogrignonensis]NNV21944.1 dipeptide epimerase [Brucella pseudogrignonensis]OYR25337.1 mandelate racemase/muconate lactonizing enzyme family protein [Brucella pseudogrignonensis]
MHNSLKIIHERYPIAGKFTISRGSKTEAAVIVCEIGHNGLLGRGECVPYARYGESIESVSEQIEAVRSAIESGATRQDIQTLMPAGAARNAVDCAMWDLEAKLSGKSVADTLGAPTRALETAITVSLGTPEEMAESTAKVAHYPLIKVKMGGDNDIERIHAVANAAPNSRIIIDANEGWTEDNIEENMAAAAKAGVVLIEQPLPAGKDDILSRIERPVIICADESVHTSVGLEDLAKRYDAVNIKLDKAGGLTEGLIMRDKATSLGLQIMVGCMVGTSLGMAPAVLLAQKADVVDLDGPLLLAHDRDPGLRYDGALVYPPEATVWG